MNPHFAAASPSPRRYSKHLNLNARSITKTFETQRVGQDFASVDRRSNTPKRMAAAAELA